VRAAVKNAGLALLLVAAPLLAQPATLQNAKVEVRAVAAGSLAAEIAKEKAGEPHWVAYEAPLGSKGHVCCFESFEKGRANSYCCGGCALEKEGASFNTTDADRHGVPLEGKSRLLVFYRMEKGRIDALRVFSGDCGLDGGGRRVVWLTGVSPDESAAFLRSLVDRDDEDLAEHALTALALHATPRATQELLELAHRSPDADLRGKALFWLAQQASEKAAAAITDAIRDDPDTEVKVQAVFALSQLPKDEGVPRLIQVARTHKNPEVRQQAIFWLGQSKDGRALDYIERLLTR
jgi:HEAT repeat protein